VKNYISRIEHRLDRRSCQPWDLL